MMKKYLVIGNPIEHSLSPKLHNYWIKKNNIDAVYEKKQLKENDINTYSKEELLKELRKDFKFDINNPSNHINNFNFKRIS